MHISDVIELTCIHEDKPLLKGQLLQEHLLGRLLERNATNMDIIRKYIRHWGRRQRKMKTQAVALRETNTSERHNSNSQSLKVSALSIESIESNPSLPEQARENPEVVLQIDEKELEEPQEIEIAIKTKTIYLEPIHSIEPAPPSDLANPAKTQPDTDQKSRCMRQSLKNQLRKALFQKIRDMQEKNRQQQTKGSMLSFLRGQPIYEQQSGIKRLQLRSEKYGKKVNTEGNELRQSGLLCSLSRKHQPLNNQLRRAEQTRSKEQMFPEVTRGYMERNKRCLHIFLKMSKQKNRSIKGKINLVPEIKVRNMFKVSTVQLKNRI